MIQLRELLTCLETISQDLELIHSQQCEKENVIVSSTYMQQAMIERLGNPGALYLNYENMAQTLEEEHKILFEKQDTVIALAESCTLGLANVMLGLHDRVGEYFHGSVITYKPELKVRLLGVPQETIDKFGVCSGPTAEAMADGVRRLVGCKLGVSTTGACGSRGVSGPDGSDSFTFAGTVFVGISAPEGTTSFRFSTPPGVNLSREQNMVAFSFLAHKTAVAYLQSH